MSRAYHGGTAPPDEALDIGLRVATRRAEAQRRAAVRRRRRQTLPAIVAGSASLAGVGLAGSWINSRLPKAAPVVVLAPADPPAMAVDRTKVAALERQLTADEQALQALSRAAGAAGKAGPGAIALSPGSALTGAVRPPVAAAPLPVAASAVRPVVKAPATHGTTGASHVH